MTELPVQRYSGESTPLVPADKSASPAGGTTNRT